MFIEVESSRNFEGSVFLRFKEVGPAQLLGQVKLYDWSPRGEWYDVIGWTNNETEPLCAALAQPVEDSGAGFVYLVFGGVGGIRLKPTGIDEQWSVESMNQWGDSHLLLSEKQDLCLQKPNP